jgi:dihydrofolate reductase
MFAPYRFEGYAIVSSDGMIADAHGAFPEALVFKADQRYLERELDHVDAVIHGRHSHEGQANSPARRRLVLTRKVAAFAPDPHLGKCMLWNPAGASVDEACCAMGRAGGTIAILGGPDVYGLFLEIGYDVFHLCRAGKVRLPGGVPIFSQVRSGRSPEDVLRHAGLRPGPRRVLDQANALTLVTWTRAPAPA